MNGPIGMDGNIICCSPSRSSSPRPRSSSPRPPRPPTQFYSPSPRPPTLRSSSPSPRPSTARRGSCGSNFQGKYKTYAESPAGLHADVQVGLGRGVYAGRDVVGADLGVRAWEEVGAHLGPLEANVKTGGEFGAHAQVGRLTKAGVKCKAGVSAGTKAKFGDGGAVGVGFGRGQGFGAGGEVGLNDKGSAVANGEAGGFGGGLSVGGDHLIGVSAKAFGINVDLKLPKFF